MISAGELAPGRSGKRGVLQRATNFFAVQMLWGVVLARKSDQWEFLAFLMALNPTPRLFFFFFFFFFFYIMRSLFLGTRSFVQR